MILFNIFCCVLGFFLAFVVLSIMHKNTYIPNHLYDKIVEEKLSLDRGKAQSDLVIEGQATKIQQLLGENSSLQASLNKTINQKKSSEVKTGYIAEQLAPFLEGFPVDPKKTDLCPVMMPIDYICFDCNNNIIHFIEVKSGDAKLSDKQKKIKQIVEDKNVKFHIFRINNK